MCKDNFSLIKNSNEAFALGWGMRSDNCAIACVPEVKQTHKPKSNIAACSGIPKTHESRIVKKDLTILFFLLAISAIMNYFPYNTKISFVLQLSILVFALMFFNSRPVFVIPIILFFHVIPSVLFFTKNTAFVNYYQVNYETIIFLCSLFLLLSTIKSILTIKRKNWGIIIYGLLSLVSCFYAKDITEYTAKTFSISVMYLSLPFFISDGYDVEVAFVSFVLSSIVYSINMFVIFRLYGNIYEIGSLINRNYVALVTNFFFMSATSFILSERFSHYKVLRWFSFLSCLLLLYLLISFASRSAFIVLSFYLLALNLIILKKDLKIFMIELPLFAVLFMLLINSNIYYNLLDRFFEENTMYDANGRTVLWKQYWDGFVNSSHFEQLFGHGINCFSAYYNYTWLYSHNSYLEILLTLGVIGVLTYVISLIISTCHLWKRNAIVSLGLIISLIHMFSIELHQDLCAICFIIVSMCFSNSVSEKQTTLSQKT